MPTPTSPVLPNQLVKETIFAKDQPQYQPLPSFRTAEGIVITRWRFAWQERLRLLFTGDLWLEQHTFNHPLQPVRMNVHCPIAAEEDQ